MRGAKVLLRDVLFASGGAETDAQSHPVRSDGGACCCEALAGIAAVVAVAFVCVVVSSSHSSLFNIVFIRPACAIGRSAIVSFHSSVRQISSSDCHGSVSVQILW